MHAPSVGEGWQARPVLERARLANPRLQLVYTWFSPSAEQFAASLDVDWAGPLPLDTPGNAQAVLAALQPTALVFAKADVWPVLAEAAHARGVRLGLVSATLARGSSRDRFARALLRDAYAALDAIGAIDQDHAGRLVALGARSSVISVTGDTRFDQVWQRARDADRSSPLLLPFRDDRPTLVAGSTWPADERHLFAAWPRLLHEVGNGGRGVGGAGRRPRLIVAPHEPSPVHSATVARWAQQSTLSFATLGSAEAGGADVVLVDRVGVLGELYSIATVAFVGGGFHDAGLHSVLEPAAFGVPVIFGPRHTGSRDALLLLAAGAADWSATTEGIARALDRWLLQEPAGRASAGASALAVVEAGRGAADRSWQLVAALLATSG